jgi:hypothetical protein
MNPYCDQCNEIQEFNPYTECDACLEDDSYDEYADEYGTVDN